MQNIEIRVLKMLQHKTSLNNSLAVLNIQEGLVNLT